MIKWALRLTAIVLGVSVTYGFFAPKPVQVAVRSVPTYAVMVGE